MVMKNGVGVGAVSTVRVLLCALVLVGCGGGGDPGIEASALTPQEAMARLEASGDLPTLERGASLGGMDVNRNGVRDDIDRYIESKYVLPQERKAAMQLARSLQQMLLANTSDAAALRATTEAGGKAIDCIFDTFSQEDGYQQGSRLSSALEALTTNTKARLQAYLAFNRAVSGSVTGSFKGRGCD
jgi:hypothetical protein